MERPSPLRVTPCPRQWVLNCSSGVGTHASVFSLPLNVIWLLPSVSTLTSPQWWTLNQGNTFFSKQLVRIIYLCNRKEVELIAGLCKWEILQTRDFKEKPWWPCRRFLSPPPLPSLSPSPPCHLHKESSNLVSILGIHNNQRTVPLHCPCLCYHS